MYTQEVLDRFRNPRNVGEIKGANKGKVGNLKCGDILELFIKIRDNVIVDARFLTYGCCAAIAASDVLCDLIKGKTLEEAEKLTKDDIVKELGGELPEPKIHCSLLGIEALKRAIKDYKKK